MKQHKFKFTTNEDIENNLKELFRKKPKQTKLQKTYPTEPEPDEETQDEE